MSNLQPCVWEYTGEITQMWIFFLPFLMSILEKTSPSPERACPDTDGGGEGLGGKSDIMPCSLFLRFSEPGEKRERENIQSVLRGGEMMERPADETNERRRKAEKKTHYIP